MSDIFISHVEEDQADALQIAQGLEEHGYSTWYYERDSIPGPSYLLQTGDAIERSRAVILIISLSSLGSHQITKEIVRAHETGKPFIPVLIGVSHAEFQARQPEWREALGAAASVRITAGDARSVVPRIIAGVEALGIRPAGRSRKAEDRLVAEVTALPGPVELAHVPLADRTASPPPATSAWRQTWQRYRPSPWLWATLAGLAIVLVFSAVQLARSADSPTATATPTKTVAAVASSGQAATVTPTKTVVAVISPGRSATPTATMVSIIPGATVTPRQPATATSTPVAGHTVSPATTRAPQAIQTYTLPLAEPWDIVFDGTSLRALFEGQLVKLELVEAEGRFRATDHLKTFSHVSALTWDPLAKRYWTVRGSVWMTDREVALTDEAGAVVATYRVADVFDGSLAHVAWDGEYLWVSSDKGALYKTRADTQRGELSIIDSYAPSVTRFPGMAIDGMAWAGEHLWVLSGGIVSKLDRSARRLCRLELPSGMSQPSWYGAEGIAWDGTYVWVAHKEANVLFRVDPGMCK